MPLAPYIRLASRKGQPVETNINEAIQVLVVGMTTVFLILSLVVLSGNVLIRFLGRVGFVLNEDEAEAELPKSVIAQAISKWSGGKAKVVSIKRKE